MNIWLVDVSKGQVTVSDHNDRLVLGVEEHECPRWLAVKLAKIRDAVQVLNNEVGK